jgi:hypothetical protein
VSFIGIWLLSLPFHLFGGVSRRIVEHILRGCGSTGRCGAVLTQLTPITVDLLEDSRPIVLKRAE